MGVTLKSPESNYTYGTNQDIHVLDCASCGISFGITAAFEKRRREDHKGFYCPNGHSNVYTADNEEEKLRKQLEQKQNSLRYERDRAGRLAAELGQTNATLRSTKAAKTRIKRDRDAMRQRIAEGVCPCCGRQFKSVQAHMRMKHPEKYQEFKQHS